MSRLDEIRARDNLAKSATYHRQGEDKELMTELRDALSDRAYLLDVVDRAQSWPGVLEFIDRTYPSEMFTGESGDSGTRIIVLMRENGRLWEMVQRAKRFARRVQDVAWDSEEMTAATEWLKDAGYGEGE